MKCFIAIVTLLGWSSSFLYGQSACGVNNVHTNPDPEYVRPTPESGQPAYRTNHFDWMAPYWPLGWTDLPTNFDVPAPPPGANYKHIESPFFAPIPRMGYLAKEELSDFHPRDGWELVSMDFGMENATEPIRRSGTFIEPHLLLYNKHTSTLRFLLPLVDDDDASFTSIELRLEPRIGEDASGLFAGTGGVLNPLDQPSPTRTVSSRVQALDLPYLWNHVEVPVFYDPCSCTLDQKVVTEFRSITEGEINLYGLYAGTISTLVAESDDRALPFPSTFQNPEDYLASLNGRELGNIRPGSIVAKDKEALTDNYEQWVQSLENRNSGSLLAGIYDAVSFFGDVVGLFGVEKILGVDVAKVAKGLGVASKLHSKLVKTNSAQINPEHYLPSYTQGEIMLNGGFTQTTPLSGSTQNIALPGTPWTSDEDEVLPFKSSSKPQYPLYNETLGLFAILHAPKVKVRTGGNTHIDPHIEWYDGYRREWRQYQFDGDLDYVWNPASHVDVENTRIHAALIVEQSAPDPSATEFCPAVSDFNVINGERLYDSDVINDEAESSVYATEFVGLECLSELPLTIDRGRGCVQVNQIPDPGFFRSTDTVVIRLVMDVRFKPNEYGVRNRSTIIYTLPVELVDEEDTLIGNGMPVYDENLTVGSITHTNPYEKFVHSTITINGEVKTNPTTNLASYVAGEKIVVQSGATIGMNTRLALDYGTPCGKPRIAPYSGDLNAFCSSNQYKAKEIINEVRAGDGPNHDAVSNELVRTLYARVEMRTGTLEVVSESTDEAQVRVDVYDILGNLLTSAMGQNTDEALTRTMIDTNSMAAGGYVLVVSSCGRSRTLKILYSP